MYCNIFCTGTRISINNCSYNNLLEDVVYSTGSLYHGIKNVKIEDTNITGVFSFRIQ